MQRDAKYLFRVSTIILFFVIISVYTFYQARRIIEGPRITIEAPKNGERVNDSLLAIKGVAENINSITLDDRPIFIDEKGNVDEKLLLYPGYNIIKIEAKDKFGKDKLLKLQVVYDAPTPETPSLATTTASSSANFHDSLMENSSSSINNI